MPETREIMVFVLLVTAVTLSGCTTVQEYQAKEEVQSVPQVQEFMEKHSGASVEIDEKWTANKTRKFQDVFRKFCGEPVPEQEYIEMRIPTEDPIFPLRAWYAPDGGKVVCATQYATSTDDHIVTLYRNDTGYQKYYYLNEEGVGYRFILPENWTVEQVDQDFGYYIQLTPDENLGNMSIRIDDTYTNVLLVRGDESRQERMKYLMEAGSDITVLDQHPVTRNGIPGFTVESETRKERMKSTWLHTEVNQANVSLVVAYKAQKNDYTKGLPAVETVLDSFKRYS